MAASCEAKPSHEVLQSTVCRNSLTVCEAAVDIFKRQQQPLMSSPFPHAQCIGAEFKGDYVGLLLYEV